MSHKVARAGEFVGGQKLLPGTGVPGPGRPKGSKNTKTPEQRKRARDILQRILREGPTPLEVMWRMLRGSRKYNEDVLNVCRAMAPYVHPKLSQIELSGQLGITHEEALARLERMDDPTVLDELAEEIPYEIIEEAEQQLASEEDDEAAA